MENVKTQIESELLHKINFKTKPLGSLGQLEDIALQIGKIQNTLSPELKNPAMLVFAADHGIVDEKVSSFPKDVTWQMVMNFLAGGAAINVFCKQNNINIKVVDAGVDYDFGDCKGLVHAKIAHGTRNICLSKAMTMGECEQALAKGAELVEKEFKAGCNIIGFGEMGIGNTSSATLLMSKYCALPIEDCVGRGAGLTDHALAHKTDVLASALAHHPNVNDPKDILATFGGLEIAMMCGGMIKAHELGMIVMVDGFIATSAALAAKNIKPGADNNFILCHQSKEKGHQRMLSNFSSKPILDMGLRLGEGTGAALAYPLIQAAVNFVNEMASFESAGVDNAG